MIRIGLLAVAALAAGALGAHLLLEDPGYVVVGIGPYLVETSVPVLVLALAAGYVLVRLAVHAWRAPRAVGAALGERRRRRSSERLTRGLIHLTEGDFRRSERLLTHGSRGGDTRLVNCLLAARAAQLQGSPARRDEWLAKAERAAPDAAATVLLTKAELELDAGELDAARGSLERLRAARPDHPRALALTARTLEALDNRPALAALLADLPRAALAETELRRLAGKALEHAFAEPDLTRERVDTCWRCLPGAMRKAPALLARRALALERIGHGADAETELRRALKRDFAPELVRAYGEVTGADRLAQLKRVERWLQTHPEDATLLFTAARLSLANELWGKARAYYESGLALAPDAGAYAAYGELLERLGEPADAAQAFESGLRLASGTPRRLPALKGPSTRTADGSTR